MEVGHPSKEAMKTCSVRSRHRDQYQSDNRDPNDKTKPFKQQIIETVLPILLVDLRYQSTNLNP